MRVKAFLNNAYRLIFARDVAASQPIFYVNPSTGSDSNDGLTTGTAFATIQKAIDNLTTIDCNGLDPDIIVLSGSYTISTALVLKNLVGVGVRCTIKSQGGTVTLTSPNAAGAGVFNASCTTLYRFDGITFTTVSGFNFRALGFVSGTSLEIKDCKFIGSGSRDHGVDAILGFNATIVVLGTLTTEAGFSSIITTWLCQVDITNVSCVASAATVFYQYVWLRTSGITAYNITQSGTFTGSRGRFTISAIAGNLPPGDTGATWEYPTTTI